MKNIASFLMVAFVPWASLWHPQGEGIKKFEGLKKVRVRIGDRLCRRGQDFQAALAITLEERNRGLSGRKHPLDSNEAMLFLFENPIEANFWMKDTWIPLSIYYFDAKGKISSSYRMDVEQNPDRPEKRYPSRAAITAAVETVPDSIKHADLKDYFLCVEFNSTSIAPSPSPRR